MEVINKRTLKDIYSYVFKSGLITITKDNIHLYYEFMSGDNKKDYKEILDTLLVSRKNIINDILFNAYYERFKGGYTYQDIGRYRIKQTIFGVKDTLKPIDEYIEEIKASSEYEKYLLSSKRAS